MTTADDRRPMRSTPAVELRDLETFVVVAEELHFARAAQRLHVVPAAVTGRIQALEQQFGLVLFARTSRRVSLTDAGLRLVEAARSVLHAVDELQDLAADLSGEEALRLSVAVGPNLGDFLHPVLARLSERLPGLRPTGVSVWSAEGAAAVQKGEVDAAILRGPVLRTGLEAIPIGETLDSSVALPAEDALTRLERPLRPDDFDDRPVLIPDRAVAPRMHDGTAAYFTDAGIRPRWRAHRLQGFELLLPFVAISGAAALIPALDPRSLPPGVASRPLERPGPRHPVLLVTRADDRSTATAALRAIARESGDGGMPTADEVRPR